MKLYKYPFMPMDCNCYILADDDKNCVIIDLGGDFSQIEGIIKANELKVLGVLFTHGHFDHVLGASSALERGIPLYVSFKDGKMLESSEGCLASYVGLNYTSVKEYNVVKEGTFSIGNFTVKALETPGHTAGSLTYIIGDNMFTGDVLFKDGIGRTDLPTGDLEELKTSINRLIGQDFNYNVHPGHGESTTLEDEKLTNSYVRIFCK